MYRKQQNFNDSLAFLLVNLLLVHEDSQENVLRLLRRRQNVDVSDERLQLLRDGGEGTAERRLWRITIPRAKKTPHGSPTHSAAR